MFSGLGEECTRFRKKKRKKKKNFIAARRGLVGMKGYLKIYYRQRCEISLAVLKPFLNETVFYAKLAGRFSGSKTKVT